MDKVKDIFDSPEHAANYEQKAKKANWLGPEILLGLVFRYIQPRDKILDLGIGTGLVAELFHKAGLQVYGMDFSLEMLKVCNHKDISSELKEHDLRDLPYPYAADSMDHIVCGGVMHIFEDISMIFQEVARIVKPGGIFAFICADHQVSSRRNTSGRCQHSTIYNHNRDEIKKLFDVHSMKLVDSLEFFVYMQGDETRKHSFLAYTAVIG